MPLVIKLGLVFVVAFATVVWGQGRAPVTNRPPDATGSWRSDAVPSWTVVLKADGPRLTGAISNCSWSGNIEIFDGRVDGNSLAFKCRSADGDRTLAFVGKIVSDEIVLRWELEVREGGRAPDARDQFAGTNAPREFAMRRVSDGAGAVIVDRIAERNRRARPASSPVTFERILHADREPQNWLTYSGTVLGHRHSLLSQITPGNIGNLELAWIWSSQSSGRFEATPLVVDGVMYTVQAPNDVVALDALTGQVLWTHAYAPPPDVLATGGGGRPNRGLAMLGTTIFLGTLDAHLLAIDARSGKLLWNTTVADASDPSCKRPNAPCYVITHAPLVVKDTVIVGTGGGDGWLPGLGIRGFVAAFSVVTGKEVWRFSTIPAPGEPGHNTWAGESWKTGGAGVWNTGTYDPDLNLTYWGTGNPVPVYDGSSRLGDNLYSSSVVALDAGSGALKWYYQFTPHDQMDWDSAHVPVLADLEWQGQRRKVMLLANKNGVMYVLDRATGQFLMGKPFVEVDWLDRFDDNGRPVFVAGKPKADSTPGRNLVGTGWYPPSFSPTTGLFYIPARERTDDGPNNAYGAIRAFDPSGQLKWEFRRTDAWFASGVLTTASGLLFSGTEGEPFSGPSAARAADGYFYALDAQTGQLLWHRTLGASVHSGVISYSAGGRQHIAVTAGNLLFAFALRDQPAVSSQRADFVRPANETR